MRSGQQLRRCILRFCLPRMHDCICFTFSTGKPVTDQYGPAETALVCLWKGFLVKKIRKVDFRLSVNRVALQPWTSYANLCLFVWLLKYVRHLFCSLALGEKLKGASIFAHACIIYDDLPKLQGLIHLSHASLGNARSLIKDWIFHHKFVILLATCSLSLSLSPLSSVSSPLSPPVPPLPSGSLFHIISHFQSCTYSAGSLHVSVRMLSY